MSNPKDTGPWMVLGCWSCPWHRRKSMVRSECTAHPEWREPPAPDGNEPPPWCMLRRAPVLVQLGVTPDSLTGPSDTGTDAP